jgi:hypothetical protein
MRKRSRRWPFLDALRIGNFIRQKVGPGTAEVYAQSNRVLFLVRGVSFGETKPTRSSGASHRDFESIQLRAGQGALGSAAFSVPQRHLIRREVSKKLPIDIVTLGGSWEV